MKLFRNGQEFCDISDLQCGESTPSASQVGRNEPIASDKPIIFLAMAEPETTSMNGVTWAIHDGKEPFAISINRITPEEDAFFVNATQYTN